MTPRRLVLASVPPLVLAVVLGLLTPRGPISPAQAIVSLGTCGVAGLLSGWLARSRWAMLLGPAVFALTFEIVRIDAASPTVDAPRFTGMYAWIALLAGRGVHALLSLAPLAIGAAWGAGWARRQAAARFGRQARGTVPVIARRALAGVFTVGLVAIAVVAAQPARTPPILGPDGVPSATAVAELTRVPAGERQLSVLLRGHDTNDPLLLFLAGGPGGSELGAMRRHASALEEHFIVATLDQRGTGRSYDQLDRGSAHTVDTAVADVLAVSRHLLDRFDEQWLYLVGQSWGTILGSLAARDHPELYAAYIGVGQMVDPFETDAISYADALGWARQHKDSSLVSRLEEIGPPPYDDLLDLATVSGTEQEVYPYDHSVNAEGAGQMMENVLVPEYGTMDLVGVIRGLLDTISVLYPQLETVDLREDVPRLGVPVYLAQGRHEIRGRADLAAQWFDALDAPEKHWVDFDTSGHRPIFEQPRRFADLLVDTVLARTRPAVQGGGS